MKVTSTIPKYANVKFVSIYNEQQQRSIDVAIFGSEKASNGVIVFSHGYNYNREGTFLHYRYLTNYLAQNGYLVLAIQQEQPFDPLLPKNGLARMVRLPNWKRGAASIDLVLKKGKTLFPEANWRKQILIGHSNGGDQSLFFLSQHPTSIYAVITLDHRRMPIPIHSKAKVLTLRSSDEKPDVGVIPSLIVREQNQIKLIQLSNIKHGEMMDFAPLSKLNTIRLHCKNFLDTLK